MERILEDVGYSLGNLVSKKNCFGESGYFMKLNILFIQGAQATMTYNKAVAS